MSTTRGRAIRSGAMVVDPQGASGRTTADATGAPLIRPQYAFRSGVIMPNAGGGGGASAAFFDLSQVASWRLIFAAAAVAYIIGFHVTLGRVRVGVAAAG